MKVTINGKRYDLSGMRDLGVSTREHGGVNLVAAYFGPKSRRIIQHTYSIWASGRNDGTVVGDQWDVCEPGDGDYGHVVQRLEDLGADLSDAPMEEVAEG